MFIDHPHPIAREELSHASAQEEGVGVRMFDRMRQMLCGLHGHDNLLQFEHERMYLRCASCGYESPGWELTEAPPVSSVPDDVRPRTVVPAHLMGERRIA